MIVAFFFNKSYKKLLNNLHRNVINKTFKNFQYKKLFKRNISDEVTKLINKNTIRKRNSLISKQNKHKNLKLRKIK